MTSTPFPPGQGPNLFILGAPKCGTTSMAAYLQQHPEVAVSQPKETNYYGPYGYSPRMTAEQYCESMGHKPDARYRCEATPNYLGVPETVKRIAKENPDARYIVMVRDQADLAFSMHQQVRLMGLETIAGFEEAWQACDDRRAGKRVPMSCDDARRLFYDQRSEVGRQISEALAFIPRDRIIVIEMQALRVDMAQVWTQLCAFLEISPQVDIDFTAQNLRKTIRFPAMLRVLRAASRVKQRLGIRGGLGVGQTLSGIAAPVATKREALSPDMRAKLQDFYAEDRRLLGQVMRAGPHLRAGDGVVLGGGAFRG